MATRITEELLKQTDEELRRDGVAIPMRPQLAVGLIQKKLSTDEEWTLESPPVRRVLAWYEREYGERLKHDFSPGRIAVLLHGDVYLMQIPLFITRCPNFIVSGDPPQEEAGNEVYNILDAIKDLTAIRRHLDRQQCKQLWEAFHLGRTAFEAIRNTLLNFLLVGSRSAEPCVLLDHALQDHLAAVDMILRGDLGPARFQILQAAEKSIKAGCAAHGRNFTKTHDLARLAAEVQPLVDVPRELLSAVQCSPSVRYGEGLKPSTVETIEAHHASLQISSLLAPAIGAAI